MDAIREAARDEEEVIIATDRGVEGKNQEERVGSWGAAITNGKEGAETRTFGGLQLGVDQGIAAADAWVALQVIMALSVGECTKATLLIDNLGVGNAVRRAIRGRHKVKGFVAAMWRTIAQWANGARWQVFWIPSNRMILGEDPKHEVQLVHALY